MIPTRPQCLATNPHCHSCCPCSSYHFPTCAHSSLLPPLIRTQEAPMGARLMIQISKGFGVRPIWVLILTVYIPGCCLHP